MHVSSHSYGHVVSNGNRRRVAPHRMRCGRWRRRMSHETLRVTRVRVVEDALTSLCDRMVMSVVDVVRRVETWGRL